MEAVLEGMGKGDGMDSGNKSNKGRYQLSYYDTAANSGPPSQGHTAHKQAYHPASNIQQQALYSNTPPLPNLQLDPNEGQKQKQSQTLPSPNRQISRLANQSSTPHEIGSISSKRLPIYPKDDVIGNNTTTASMSRSRLPPPSLKPTIQQIFPPSERAPPGLGGIPNLVCMKECDIEKFAADNLNLHSKGIFRKKVENRFNKIYISDNTKKYQITLSKVEA